MKNSTNHRVSGHSCKNGGNGMAFWTALMVFLISCSTPKAGEERQEHFIQSEGSLSGPFLTRTPQGKPVLSWISEPEEGAAVMCYAVSEDNGRTFGSTVTIHPSNGLQPNGENLPKLLFKPGGEIIAAWGVPNPNPKNKYSGLVYYSQSFDTGTTWSAARPLVTDTASYDQRYFDMAVLANNEAAIVWLDNRKDTEKEGSTVYFAETTGSGGFQNEKPIAQTSCQCCRTDLYMGNEGEIHVAFRDIVHDSIRDISHVLSMDGGTTFSEETRVSEDNWIVYGCPHTGPTLAQSKAGLHVAWFTAGGQPGIYYAESKDNGRHFDSRKLLRADARHPQMTVLSTGDVAIAWEETVRKKDHAGSKIVMYLNKADGQELTYGISSDTVMAGFPVILSVSPTELLLAWVQGPLGSQMSHGKSAGGTIAYTLFPVR